MIQWRVWTKSGESGLKAASVLKNPSGMYSNGYSTGLA